MKNLQKLLTIAGLLLLVSCGKGVDSEVIERCLNDGDCQEVTIETEAETNDQQDERLDDLEEELTATEKRLLCLEGQQEHCDGTNPFINISLDYSVGLDSNRFSYISTTVAKTMKDGRDTVTELNGPLTGKFVTLGTGNYKWRTVWKIKYNGQVEQYRRQTNIDNGLVRLSRKVATGTLENDAGTWYFEMTRDSDQTFVEEFEINL